jgi:hypothetical protein
MSTFVSLPLAAMFWVGIILPVLWIFGALMGPTAGVEARGAG